MITCRDFIKIAFKLYNKNNWQYNVENYTFKNFYYSWRQNSMKFTKYSAIENPETKDNSHFLRYYTYCTLYNKS